MKQFLQGEFILRLADKSRIGTIVCRHPTGWGLTPMYTRRGAEAGDYLTLIFDLCAREVTASIGDAGVLEQFAEA